jgi:hypothetical protein
MLTVSLIGDKQFLDARGRNLPVRIVGPASFVLPSATRPELTEHHRVTFDDPEQPTLFECSCEAHSFGRACWAAARALDVLVLLAGANVTVGDLAAPDDNRERVDEDGEIERAVMFDGPLPRFEHRRTFRPEPEGDPDAVLAAPLARKKVERVGGFQI